MRGILLAMVVAGCADGTDRGSGGGTSGPLPGPGAGAGEGAADPGSKDDGPGDGEGEGEGEADPADGAAPDPDPVPVAEDVPEDAVPCEHPGGWPLSITSERRPIVVHYQAEGDAAVARQVVDLLELSWDVEVDGLGFTAPLPDGGLCGDTDDFDVFLWRGHVESFVDVLEENPDTPWDDLFSYMLIDAWGPYGGTELPVTVAHEFNHACQASDDWYDSSFIFEATATFMEKVVFPEDDDWLKPVADFQDRPHWSLDHDDGYETWFMYGAALYLQFLREQYFGGDAAFVARMWKGMRQPRFRSEAQWENEPDYADSLDVLLGEAAPPTTFLDTIPEFARWRRAFEGLPPASDGAIDLSATPPPVTHALRRPPALIGTAYVDVSGLAEASEGGAVTAALTDHEHPGVAWVLQALPGGERSSGDGPLELPHGTEAVAITALPAGAYDPDDRSDDDLPATLLLTR